METFCSLPWYQTVETIFLYPATWMDPNGGHWVDKGVKVWELVQTLHSCVHEAYSVGSRLEEISVGV